MRGVSFAHNQKINRRRQ